MTAPASNRSVPDVAVLKAVGEQAGLHSVGVCEAAPFVDTRAVLEERKAAGLSDTMQFTYRNPERSTTPDRIVPEAQSLIVGARAYPSWSQLAAARHTPAPTATTGRIASYAWRDHYADLRVGLEAIAAELRAAGWIARVVADDNALVDRAAAVRAGLGWFGKNSNVLIPNAGSFFVLGSVVTDAPVPTDQPSDLDCGTCRRCLDGCPTGAIVAPGVVDAGRCLAWLLQREGMFPVDYREALGNRIYGCDDCQEVCPPSRQNPAELNGAEAPHIDLAGLLAAANETIEDRHGRWYIPRRDMNYIRRNALIGLANAAATNRGEVPEAVVGAIESCLRHEDPMLRAHAVWAADRIGRPDLVDVVRGDDNPLVQEELARR